jgi:hypothetical protein
VAPRVVPAHNPSYKQNCQDLPMRLVRVLARNARSSDRDVEASHEGLSFCLDVSAHLDNPPYRKMLSCKPSPFETAMPASVDSP